MDHRDRKSNYVLLAAGAAIAVALAVCGVVLWRHPSASHTSYVQNGSGAAVLETPAAAHGVREEELYPPTLSPLELLTRCPQRSAALETWAANWQKSNQRVPATEELDALKAALASAEVPSVVRFLIAKKAFEAKDVPTSMVRI